MSLTNVYADKIPMNWVDTKSGKKKFIEFKKAKDPKGVIYYGLAATSTSLTSKRSACAEASHPTVSINKKIYQWVKILTSMRIF